MRDGRMVLMVTNGRIERGIKEIKACKGKLLKEMLRDQENIQKYQRKYLVSLTYCRVQTRGCLAQSQWNNPRSFKSKRDPNNKLRAFSAQMKTSSSLRVCVKQT